MAQLVKCFPYKHLDLRLIPRTHVKQLDVVVCPWHPSGKAGISRSVGFTVMKSSLMVSTRSRKEYFLKQHNWHEEQNPRLASDLHKLHTQAHACTCAHTYIHTYHQLHQTQEESKGIASCINFLRYPLLRDEPRAGSYRSQRSRLGTRAGSKLEGGLLGNGATQRFLLFFSFSSFVLHLLCRPLSPSLLGNKARIFHIPNSAAEMHLRLQVSALTCVSQEVFHQGLKKDVLPLLLRTTS